MTKILPDYVRDLQDFRDALAMLPSASGLVIRNNVSTPNTNIDVDARFAVLLADAVPERARTYLASAIDLTINTTTTGTNGLDVGSRDSLTWYNFWLVWGEDMAMAGLASLSATDPTLPDGYTHKLRVGAGRTDASGNFNKFVQRGNVVMYGTNIVLTSGAAGSISTPTYVAVNTTNNIAPTAGRILGLIRVLGSSVNSGAMVSPSNNFGSIDTGANFPRVAVASNGGSQYGVYIAEFDFVLETENIYWASNIAISSANGAILACRGYVDTVNAS